MSQGIKLAFTLFINHKGKFMLIHNPKELAQYIRNQRKSQNLSQSDLGSKVGLLQRTISLFENKPDGVKLDTLFRILSATNLQFHIVQKGDVLEGSNTKLDEEW